jgi:thiamine pyrophosphate-dependent acetolactate synthase large subunit-like protein
VNASELSVERLADWGMDTVFGLPGVDSGRLDA